MAMTIAKWKRICFKERNLEAYVDYTLQWDSDCTQHLMDDATRRLVYIYEHHREWDEAEWMSPRGTAKTTVGIIAWSWLNNLYPWLQTVFISATPDVTVDCFEYALRLAREHPLLGRLRPKGVANAQKREFDTPGRRGKGRSFRARTGGSKITGIRGHFVDVDDLEVKETVTTPAQRMKMRLTLAESKNLLFKKHWFAKTMMRGTPWDEDTIYRDKMVEGAKQPIVVKEDRRWHAEVPGYYVDEDVDQVVYPFYLLPPDELDRIRRRLRNDMLFRFQYLLDTTRDEEAMPISERDLVYRDFEWETLNNRIFVIDPAGTKLQAAERVAIVQGERRGDSFSIGAYGTRGGSLFCRDMWALPCSSRRFLDQCVDMVREYKPSRIWVESNFSAWAETLRLRFHQAGLRFTIEPFWSTEDKLAKCISTLCPLTGDHRLILHTDLQDNEELRHQFLTLRYHSLPAPHDDILDNVAMAAEKLDQYLKVYRPDTLTPAAKAVAAHAPNSVVRQQARRDTGRRIAVTSSGRYREGV